MILRILGLGAGLSLGLLAVILGSAMWYAKTAPPARSDVIVVLGARNAWSGALYSQAQARVDRGIELLRAGVAPRILFTGGRVWPDRPSHAARMAEYAASRGVPAELMLIEGEAHSTLQNAIYSKQMINGGQVVLVTHGYHMLRSRLSFAWAGVAVNGVATPSAFPDGMVRSTRAVIREIAAFGFNAARTSLWHVLGWAGMSEESRIDMLAGRHRPGPPKV